jgi:hypothetical protein
MFETMKVLHIYSEKNAQTGEISVYFGNDVNYS